MPAIVKPLASVGRNIGFAGSKCCRISASVKVLFSLRNASSAFQGHSHLGVIGCDGVVASSENLLDFFPPGALDFNNLVSGSATLAYF
jgi:hypothetical protein